MKYKATNRMAIRANSAEEAIQKSGLAANSYHTVEAENVGINQWYVTRYRHFGEDSTETEKEDAMDRTYEYVITCGFRQKKNPHSIIEWFISLMSAAIIVWCVVELWRRGN